MATPPGKDPHDPTEDDHGDDPQTSREGLEQELMEKHESEVGEEIGEHID